MFPFLASKPLDIMVRIVSLVLTMSSTYRFGGDILIVSHKKLHSMQVKALFATALNTELYRIFHSEATHGYLELKSLPP